MYFWRIRRLRQSFLQGPLPQRQGLYYLLAFTLFYLLLILFHSFVPTHPPVLKYSFYIIVVMVIKVMGIYQCYRSNGGAEGKDFLPRYLALGWVELMRFLLMGLVILLAGIITVEIIVGAKVLTTPHLIWAACFVLLWLVAYYWRLCAHFRIVAIEA